MFLPTERPGGLAFKLDLKTGYIILRLILISFSAYLRENSGIIP
jgi:hypothetical protein